MSAWRQPAPLPHPHDPDTAWMAVDWSLHSDFATVDGRRVHYIDIGSGPTVVLIHGQGGCWQWWLRTAPTLAGEARVIAVDLPGFGDSDPIAGRDVIDQQIAAILGVLDHLGLSSAVIVGHSMGGLVSMELARRSAPRVRGLMIVDSAADVISASRLQLIVLAFRIFNIVFSAASGRPAFVARRPRLRGLVLSAAMKHPSAMSTALALELLPRMAAPGFMATLLAATAFAVKAVPPEVDCPTVIVWGDQDRILPLRVGQALAEQIPGARLEVLSDVGHSPMLEVPRQFNDVLTAFVRDCVRQKR